MEEAAKELHKYKPVLLGLALSSMIPEVTDEQIAEYEGLLKVSGDDRESQLIHNYDAVHGFTKEEIIKHGIVAPPLFKTGHLDRTSLLFFNDNQASTVCLKKVSSSKCAQFFNPPPHPPIPTTTCAQWMVVVGGSQSKYKNKLGLSCAKLNTA